MVHVYFLYFFTAILAGFYVLITASSAIRDAGIEPVRIDLIHFSFLQVNNRFITYTYARYYVSRTEIYNATIRVKNLDTELSVFFSEEKCYFVSFSAF